MDEIENKIDIVLKMLLSDCAYQYQKHKHETEEKVVNAIVSRRKALEEVHKIIYNKTIDLFLKFADSR